MTSLILNSGTGSRMGDLTKKQPKCMTEIAENETILSKQLKLLSGAGITKVVMTTGLFDIEMKEYCESLSLPLEIIYVKNEDYATTNYIYSIYLAREVLRDDIVLMHGDLVFEQSVIEDVVNFEKSSMTVSSTLPLPEKDFKAVILDGRISAVGIDLFENALAAQPLYKLYQKDWEVWLNSIIAFCESDNKKVYAENAFNVVSSECEIFPLDVKDRLCNEIDTPDDLVYIKNRLEKMEK